MIAEALVSDGPALALTLSVEGAVVTALSFPLRLKPLPAILASIAINFITQPVFWTVMASGAFETPQRWWPALWIGETVVWLAEAGLYLVLLADLRRGAHPVVRALALSFVANAASAGLGLALGV
jgi:hypothetical protein